MSNRFNAFSGWKAAYLQANKHLPEAEEALEGMLHNASSKEEWRTLFGYLTDNGEMNYPLGHPWVIACTNAFMVDDQVVPSAHSAVDTTREWFYAKWMRWGGLFRGLFG